MIMHGDIITIRLCGTCEFRHGPTCFRYPEVRAKKQTDWCGEYKPERRYIQKGFYISFLGSSYRRYVVETKNAPFYEVFSISEATPFTTSQEAQGYLRALKEHHGIELKDVVIEKREGNIPEAMRTSG